jgi:medium-chain acyl-[acyl-carrier-protein] hydrolase
LNEAWFPFVNARPEAEVRVFCFPYAGGTASAFRPWAAVLPPAIELVPIELPGHGTRLGEACVAQGEVLVDRIVDAIRPLTDRPFAFYGHSMGAKLAFEAARQLASKTLRHLVLSGAGAPDLRPSHHYAQLPPTALVKKLEELGGVSPLVLADTELMALLMPVLRADLTIADEFAPSPVPPLEYPITAMAGLSDPDSPPDTVRGWARYTAREFRFEQFPGGHFFIQDRRDDVLRVLVSSVLQR